MACVVVEPRSVFTPVLTPLDQIELAPEQRVMWMRYTKRSSLNVLLRCS